MKMVLGTTAWEDEEAVDNCGGIAEAAMAAEEEDEGPLEVACLTW